MGRRDRDLTQGGIVRNIWFLAVPMAAEMTLHDADHLLDLFWLGRLGAVAIAASALAETVVILASSVGIGVQVGVRAIVARRIGAEDRAGAGRAVVQAALFALLSSFVLGGLGFFAAGPALRLLGAAPDAAGPALGYLRVSFLGLFARVSFFVVNAALRGAGNAVAAMWALGAVSLVNIVVDPLLIFGIGPFPKLGVAGSATAVVISRTIGLFIQFGMLASGRLRVGLERKMTLDSGTMAEILRVGFPGTLRTLLERGGTSVLVRIIAFYGTFAVATYGIIRRIYMFALLPSAGFSGASATLVGQNLGAQQAARSERSAWIAVGHNALISGLVSGVLFAFAEPIVRIFNATPEVVGMGVASIRIVAFSYIFLASAIVLAESLNGAGDTVPPMVVNSLTLWVVQLPMAYLLSSCAGWDVNGIWVAMAATNVSNALFLAVWFKAGRWKEARVRIG